MKTNSIIAIVIHFIFIGVVISTLLLLAVVSTYVIIFGGFWFKPNIILISVVLVIAILSLIYSAFWLNTNVCIAIRRIKSEKNNDSKELNKEIDQKL